MRHFKKNTDNFCVNTLKKRGFIQFTSLVFAALLAASLCLFGCSFDGLGSSNESSGTSPYSSSATKAPEFEGANNLDLSQIPEYSNKAAIEIGDNVPDFTDDEIDRGRDGVFIDLSDLDKLGRCGVAFACLSVETLCYDERESISDVHPTAWQHSEYDFIDGQSLYNRCHLLGHALTGLNAEERNLITGTRYLNVEGMLDHEDDVHDYIERTGNHVLYRVTPVFDGENLLASGVRMEAYSIEDKGKKICFDLYCYNVQPGVEIDYANGDNWESGTSSDDGSSSATSSKASGQTDDGEIHQYVLNTKSMKFHLPDCEGVKDISDRNKDTYEGTRQSLIDKGYEPCGSCKP